MTPSRKAKLTMNFYCYVRAHAGGIDSLSTHMRIETILISDHANLFIRRITAANQQEKCQKHEDEKNNK